MTIAALIVAAGRGSRAGTGLPKQYRRLDEKTRSGTHVERFLRACDHQPYPRRDSS